MFERQQGTATTGEHIDSYYAASLNRKKQYPALEESIDSDICIVGAGFSGLSTAIHLAESGHKVTLVEGKRVGWGASGRNGGQMVNGINASLDSIERKFGKEKATAIAALVQEGGTIIRRLSNTYGIRCDLKNLNIFTACNSKHMRELEARQALWRSYGIDNFDLLDSSALQRHVASNVYKGGMIDRTGGHIHPLNLAAGEAAAFESLGGKIYEQTPITSIDRSGTPVLTTPNGTIRCKTLVLCGNAYLGDTEPALKSRVMPVSTQVMATEPLSPELAKKLLPTDACVEDIRYILDYYRLSADNRLLFGGGTVYGGTDPADIKAKLRPAMLKVFPELTTTKIDYAWSGNFALSYTRVPQLGRLDANTYFAHGYSGHGVTGSHLFGRILSDAINGDLSGFDVFSDLKWIPFPGGRALRAPYSTIGSWWYGLRDKLAI